MRSLFYITRNKKIKKKIPNKTKINKKNIENQMGTLSPVTTKTTITPHSACQQQMNQPNRLTTVTNFILDY